MSNEQQSPKSLLQQIADEAKKAKREQVKKDLKVLYDDYNKAVSVVTGIEQKIVALLQSVGEDENTIRSMLSAE